jgi:hypothetical protein
VIIAVHISQERGELGESVFIQSAVRGYGIVSALPQLFQIPSRLGDANDGNIETTMFD